MSKKLEITCDGCGADITYAENIVDYRLILKVEDIPLRGNTCTDVGISPPLEEDKYFCRLSCLKKWIGIQ